MKHEYLKHDKCEIDNCLICDGGLLVCTVCKGAESSLTTECFGEPLTDKELYCVSNGDDYKDGKWVMPYIHA